MPQDNVTPFRPRRPPPKPARGPGGGMNLQSQRGRAILVQFLVLACFAASFAFAMPPASYIGLAIGVAALAIASSNRMDGMPWARTHHEHALRTIIIGAAAWTLLSLLIFLQMPALAPIVFWGRVIIVLWAGLRALIGLGLAIFRRPIPNPRGPLI